jgi:hypothetical protein
MWRVADEPSKRIVGFERGGTCVDVNGGIGQNGVKDVVGSLRLFVEILEES